MSLCDITVPKRYCNITAPNTTLYHYTPNVPLYNHVLQSVNGCVTMTSVVVGPSCNLTVGKFDEYIKICLSLLKQKFIHYNNL